MTDEMIEAAKTAAYMFRTRLASIDSSSKLREFVTDYFSTPSEREFWYDLASFWEMKRFAFWKWSPFVIYFPAVAYGEWSREQARFEDPRARIGFKLGSRDRL